MTIGRDGGENGHTHNGIEEIEEKVVGGVGWDGDGTWWKRAETTCDNKARAQMTCNVLHC